MMKKLLIASMVAVFAMNANALDVRKITDKKTQYLYREWKIAQIPASKNDLEKHHKIVVARGSDVRTLPMIPGMITEFARTADNALLIKVYVGEGIEDEKWRLYSIKKDRSIQFLDLSTRYDFDLSGNNPAIIGGNGKTEDLPWQMLL